LIICVQKKEKLKYELLEGVNMTHDKNSASKGNIWYDLSKVKRIHVMKNKDNRPKCLFCKKKGHVKKDCMIYQKWLSKKGSLVSCACYESNFSYVSNNTCWINFCSSIHVANIMQRFLTQRKPTRCELGIHSELGSTRYLRLWGPIDLF